MEVTKISDPSGGQASFSTCDRPFLDSRDLRHKLMHENPDTIWTLQLYVLHFDKMTAVLFKSSGSQSATASNHSKHNCVSSEFPQL